jgi:hypothetical protein
MDCSSAKTFEHELTFDWATRGSFFEVVVDCSVLEMTVDDGTVTPDSLFDVQAPNNENAENNQVAAAQGTKRFN